MKKSNNLTEAIKLLIEANEIIGKLKTPESENWKFKVGRYFNKKNQDDC